MCASMPWKEPSVRRQRHALVKALLARREPTKTLCERFGITRQTAYKFLRRFVAQGTRGLDDLSRRPHTPGKQAQVWRRRVLQLRHSHPRWGARKLRCLLHQRYSDSAAAVPTERTVERWLAAAGLTRVPGQRRRAKPARRMRCTVARRSNHIWTIDLKGWFCTGDGSKIEPLTVRDHWSRFILWTRPLFPRNERNVRRVCRRLFRRYGRPAVIRCDRGAPFFGDGPHGFTRLSLWWRRRGIRVEFVRRGIINNNAHEQMHGVLKAELSIARTASVQTQRLERWRRRYNEYRPHDALGLRTPASRYRACPAPLPTLQTPRYRPGSLVRRVQPNGDITLPGWRGTIGRAFGGLPVALVPCGPQHYRVYFASLYLGELDLTRARKLLLAPS